MKLYDFSFSWCYQAIVPDSFLLHMNKNLLPFLEIYEMMGIKLTIFCHCITDTTIIRAQKSSIADC